MESKILKRMLSFRTQGVLLEIFFKERLDGKTTEKKCDLHLEHLE